MSENTPNLPGGALPPRPAEAAKVQPKKETVRINLPPKPTAGATIKLPTVGGGGPPPATASPATIKLPTLPAGGPPPSAGIGAPATTAARGSAPPATGTGSRVAGAPTAQRPAPAGAPGVAPRAPVAAAVSGLDKGLALAAAVISLAALGSVIYLAFFLIQPVTGTN